MTPYLLLAPHMDKGAAKMLKIAMGHAKIPWPAEGPVSQLPVTSSTRFVLSVGKAGLDAWHDFGLIQISTNHGDVFEHHAQSGRRFEIMVVEHPNLMAQQSAFVKYSAREDMLRNLQRFGWLMRGGRASEFTSKVCGGCIAMKGLLTVRPAEHWVGELDGVGLCEDHYRKRAKYRRKKRLVPARDRSKPEHQIPGQVEMFG